MSTNNTIERIAAMGLRSERRVIYVAAFADRELIVIPAKGQSKQSRDKVTDNWGKPPYPRKYCFISHFRTDSETWWPGS